MHNKVKDLNGLMGIYFERKDNHLRETISNKNIKRNRRPVQSFSDSALCEEGFIRKNHKLLHM